MDRTYSTHWDVECIEGFIVKTRRKSPLGRTKYRWEGNILIWILKMGICGLEWSSSE
jgi:hypothetical protein